jgi:CheY-like chemotaxis protein
MTNPKLLAVDDSEVTQDTLKALFSSLGFDVVSAFSAEEAWVALKDGGLRPDLIILDWHLPLGMDGPELNRKIKMDEELKWIPVVAFTSKWTPKLTTPESIKWKTFIMGLQIMNKGHMPHAHVAKLNADENATSVPPKLIFDAIEQMEEYSRPVPPALREAAAHLMAEGR